MPVRLDANGVIVNASELSSEDVATKRVRCPACEKVFERWPSGWDVHASYRCSGLSAKTVEDRKREYKERFYYLFR
jgi:hypothetical protein